MNALPHTSIHPLTITHIYIHTHTHTHTQCRTLSTKMQVLVGVKHPVSSQALTFNA